MKFTNHDKNVDVVIKIQNEMKDAEKYLLNWGINWREEYQNASLPEEFFWVGEYNQSVGQKSEDMAKVNLETVSSENKGIPLKRFTWHDEFITKFGKLAKRNYSCNVPTIVWKDINTKKSSREIEFNNDGSVLFIKQGKNNSNFVAGYNVISPNVAIKINGNNEEFTYELENNVDITISNEEFAVRKDLKANKKTFTVKDTDYNFKNNIEYQVTIENNRVTKLLAIVNILKDNGKAKGRYVFKIQEDKNGFTRFRANYYTRKGTRIELPTTTPNANQIRTLFNNHEENDKIMTSFKKYVRNTAFERVKIDINRTNLTEEAFEEKENNAINQLRDIKGEIPLTGLSDRLNNLVGLFTKKPSKKEEEKGKELHLKNKNVTR